MYADEAFSVAASLQQLERTAQALREAGFQVLIADTVDDARKLVAELLPTDRTIFTATSETLRLSGIAADIDDSGHYRSVRAEAGDAPRDVEAQIRLGALPDVVVGSVHAVTEDGRLVIASASGSQLAPYASGARKAIWVVGAQKVVPDLDTALRRVRTHSLPLENNRQRELRGLGSFIGKILIIEREGLPDRSTVILTAEPIGF
ncbi:LUD domain-containing protein [Streptomyces sp. NPDC000987]|uniref:LUD domain-containing protein n=1 Tax=Streptomyces sp. NPDC000987 TaxID=3154374 RepID=UPI003319128D